LVSILVFLEESQRPFGIDFGIASTKCFNPCFSGRESTARRLRFSLEESQRRLRTASVSILVFLEESQRPLQVSFKVSILVFLEESQRQNFSNDYEGATFCFNPCFSGRESTASTNMFQSLFFWKRVNGPAITSRSALTASVSILVFLEESQTALKDVSILVFLEETGLIR
jgi:hypothetical protein